MYLLRPESGRNGGNILKNLLLRKDKHELEDLTASNNNNVEETEFSVGQTSDINGTWVRTYQSMRLRSHDKCLQTDDESALGGRGVSSDFPVELKTSRSKTKKSIKSLPRSDIILPIAGRTSGYCLRPRKRSLRK